MENLNRDTLFLLAVEMDLPSLLNFCKSSSKINDKLCKIDNIWIHKLNKEFPKENFLLNMNPKEKYIISFKRHQRYDPWGNIYYRFILK